MNRTKKQEVVQQPVGPEISYDEKVTQIAQAKYKAIMQARQQFMKELKSYRDEVLKKRLQTVVDSIGPAWYQVLSVPQRTALDRLEFAIYQDILENRPHRTAHVMRELGIYPRVPGSELMVCIYKGRNDSKAMLANLYSTFFGCSIEVKRKSYDLRAKLLLSGILYLGLKHIIQLLRERFYAEVPKEKPMPKPKSPLKPPLASPYLEKLLTIPWHKPVHKRRQQPPLPNLDSLNDDYEPVEAVPPPPIPVRSPGNKRDKKKTTIPISECDKLAGIIRIEPHQPSVTNIIVKKPVKSHRRSRSARSSISTGQTTKNAISMGKSRKGASKSKLTAPTLPLSNCKYTICGVYTINGKTSFILGNVSMLPALGHMINGGHAYVNGEYITIHCGYQGPKAPARSDPCDCLTRWHDVVIKHLKNTKCYCGHRYDYYNEGSFPPEELPFFEKPTAYTPYKFNYDTIYDLDAKQLHVKKEFKRIWETDSILQVNRGGVIKVDDKKRRKLGSKTCLGPNPTLEDILRCALFGMRRLELAALLPDLHLVPELKEWMRRRVHGPYTKHQRDRLLLKSSIYWSTLITLALHSYGHVPPPNQPIFSAAGATTWLEKKKLNNLFKIYVQKYKLSLFTSQLIITNMFWRTMFQAELPDKVFRQIYFSYLPARIQDFHLLKCYNPTEVAEWKNILMNKRYVCLPEGCEAFI